MVVMNLSGLDQFCSLLCSGSQIHRQHSSPTNRRVNIPAAEVRSEKPIVIMCVVCIN